MAFLDETFESDKMPVGENNFDPLPAGWYSARITKTEVKNTKTGAGKYIAVRYDILGPTHQGRVVFGNLNIKNQSTKAEEIGRQQLGEIMRAIGVARVTDSDQLVGGNLMIKISLTTSEQYGEGNDIKGFKAMAGAMPTMPPAAMPASAAASTAAKPTAAPPWAK